MFKFLSIALLALCFSNCALISQFGSKIPSASVIQTDVTFAVSAARDAALFNPAAESAVNALVGNVHTYLQAVQSGVAAFPNAAQAKVDIDGLIASIAAALPVSIQAQFIKLADDLEGVVINKYAAFYGYVSNTQPYIAALVQATA